MQNDLIRRAEVLEIICRNCCGEDVACNSKCADYKMIVGLDAEEVVPMDFHERCLLLEVQKRHAAEANQRHGRWESNEIPESMLSKCSECGITYGAYSFNYCPSCGAKME